MLLFSGENPSKPKPVIWILKNSFYIIPSGGLDFNNKWRLEYFSLSRLQKVSPKIQVTLFMNVAGTAVTNRATASDVAHDL